MLRLFQYFRVFFDSKMLDPKNYKIVVQCKSVDAFAKLDHTLTRELNAYRLVPTPGSPTSSIPRGIIAGIEFEITPP